MANIGTLTATLGLDTSALLLGERDAVRTFNAIQASAATTTQSIAAFNAQMSAAAGATAPRHHIDAFLREAGEGANQAADGFERADLKAVALGASVAGMPPAFSKFAAVLAFGSAGIGALSVGVGLFLQQLFDSGSAFRTYISGHEGSVKAIRSHRESLDELAKSGLQYRDVAADLIRLADVQTKKDKAQAEADLELAQAGIARLSAWHRIRNSIIAQRLVPSLAPVGDAEQIRLVTEFTVKIAELNKELGLTAPSMADEFTRMMEVARLGQKHFEDQTKAIKEAAKATDEYSIKVHDAQEALRDMDPVLGDAYKSYRINVNVATRDTEAFTKAALDAQDQMLGLGLPTPPPSIPEPMIADQIPAERDALQELMSQDEQTRESMISNATRYREVMKGAIALEAAQLKEIGVTAETVARIVELRMRQVTEQTDAMLRDSLDGLRGWVHDLSAELNATFENSFFRVMKGQFESFFDFLESITDVFLRDISRKMADSMMNQKGTGWLDTLLGIGPGSGGGSPAIPVPTPLPDDISGFAMGGIVTRPTLALIGESGPEMVVPMAKMHSARFWDSLRADAGVSASDGGATVVFNITTPDVASFKASQSQIMSRAAVALARQRRNL